MSDLILDSVLENCWCLADHHYDDEASASSSSLLSSFTTISSSSSTTAESTTPMVSFIESMSSFDTPLPSTDSQEAERTPSKTLSSDLEMQPKRIKQLEIFSRSPAERSSPYSSSSSQTFEPSLSPTTPSPAVPDGLLQPRQRLKLNPNSDYKRRQQAKCELRRMLPPCRVCQDPASGFHYGVNTCEACKGFFRRALKQGSTFFCRADRKCDVSGPLRNICSFCRYHRCLSVGMAVSAIKIGRYTYEKRTRNIMEVKNLQRNNKTAHGGVFPDQDQTSLHRGGTAPGELSWLPTRKQIGNSRNCFSATLQEGVRERRHPATVFPQTDQNSFHHQQHVRPESLLNSQPGLGPEELPTRRQPGCEDMCSTRTLHEGLWDSLQQESAESGGSSDISTQHSLEARLLALVSETSVYNGDILLHEHLQVLETFQWLNAKQALTIQRPVRPSVEERLDNVIADLVEAHNRYIIVSTYFPETFILKAIKSHLKRLRMREEILGNLPDLSDEEYIDMYKKTGIDLDGRVNRAKVHMGYLEAYIRRLIKFAKSLPGFRSLSLDDQAELIKDARADVWFLGAYKGFNSDLSVAVMPNGRCFHRTELCAMSRPEWVDACFSAAEQLKKQDARPEELIILKALLFTMTDRCHVLNTPAIDSMQDLLLACLSHSLKKHLHKRDHASLLGDALNKLTRVRSLSLLEIRNYVHNTVLFDHCNQRPLIKEMVFSSET